MMINKIVKQCLGVIDSAPHSLTVLSGVYLIFSSHIIWEAYYSVASADHISLGYIQGSRKHFWGRIQANKVVYRDVPLETAHRELFWPSFLLHNPEKNDFKNSRYIDSGDPWLFISHDSHKIKYDLDLFKDDSLIHAYVLKFRTKVKDSLGVDYP